MEQHGEMCVILEFFGSGNEKQLLIGYKTTSILQIIFFCQGILERDSTDQKSRLQSIFWKPEVFWIPEDTKIRLNRFCL